MILDKFHNRIYTVYIDIYNVYTEVGAEGRVQYKEEYKMEQKSLKPWHGIAVFAVVVAVLYFVCFPIQYKLGLIGVGITELILLGLGVGAALVFKQDLKEVFPIKKPKLRELLGVLVFWLGGFSLVVSVSGATSVLFPQEMQEVTQGMNSIMTDGSVWLSLLIVSVMPAICEEAVHRGFILHTFKNVKKEWVVVVSMAVIFGIFHLTPIRFGITAVLGGCITWVMLKTKNMVYPFLYHAFNNLFPVLVSFLGNALTKIIADTTADGQAAVTTSTTTLESFGWLGKVSTLSVYLMGAITIIPLMFAGTVLMKKKEEKVASKHVAAVFIVAGVLFMLGIIGVFGSSLIITLQTLQ